MTSTRSSLATLGALVVLALAISTAPAEAQTPIASCETSESALVPACPTMLDIERARYTQFDVTWEWERTAASPANAQVKEFLVRYQEKAALPFDPASGGKPITSKKVRRNSDNDEDYTLTLTGLTPGKMYVVGVTAVAPTGTGGANNSSELGIVGETDSATVPDDVLGLMLMPGDMMIMVEWDEATDNGSDVTGYEVQHREMGKDWPTTSSRSGATKDTSTMWTISNLKNGTEYEVRVRAASYGVTSDDVWSDVKSATPMAGAMPTPALPIFGAFALGVGLVAAGRRRLRRQRLLNS